MTYRPNTIWPIPFVLAGSLFIALGLSGICFFASQGGIGAFFLGGGFAVMGALIALTGIAAIAYRIAVDSKGISRSSWFGLVVYQDSWESLRSWTTGKVEDPEIVGRFYVEFDFAGRRWPFRIEASEVAAPGFDKFVSDIRTQAGLKEAISPRNAEA